MGFSRSSGKRLYLKDYDLLSNNILAQFYGGWLKKSRRIWGKLTMKNINYIYFAYDVTSIFTQTRFIFLITK